MKARFQDFLYLLIALLFASCAGTGSQQESHWSGPWNTLDVSTVTQEFGQQVLDLAVSCHTSQPLSLQVDPGIDPAGLADSLQNVWDKRTVAPGTTPCSLSANLHQTILAGQPTQFHIEVRLVDSQNATLLQLVRVVAKSE